MSHRPPPSPFSDPVSTAPGSSYRACSAWHFETFEPIEECPKCGRHLQDEAKVRSFGSLMTVLGGLIILIIAPVFLGLFGLFLFADPPKPDSVMKVDPVSRDMAFLAGWLFSGSLIVFGFLTIKAGRRQHENGRQDLRTYKRNLTLLFSGLGIVVFLMVVFGR